MTGKHQKRIDLLTKIALTVKPVFRARLAACLILKNDIVGLGINEAKSHPFQKQYCKHPESIYLHAEVAAIKNALKELSVTDISKCSLYVSRVKYADQYKKGTEQGLSKPCAGCIMAISAFNIRNVIFSLDGYGYDHL